MSNETSVPMITIQTTKFGELQAPADSVIEFPAGLIGLSEAKKFVLFDYRPPFSWLISLDDPKLAFVVIDGARYAEQFGYRVPFGDAGTDLNEGDEYAVLTVVTVNSDPRATTANLKAPLFVNLRNRRGTQVVYEMDHRLSLRHPIWEDLAEFQKAADAAAKAEADAKAEAEKK